MRIFISRALTSNSPFQNLLEGHTIQGLSLIDFKPIAFEYQKDADWLFFYSKNGIKYFFEQQKTTTQLPAIAVIGEASALYLKQHYSITANFVGTGHPRDTAEQFAILTKGEKVVFVQAQHSKQSVQKLLGEHIISHNLIVYNNYFKSHFEISPADILVFTSPMNVNAYFSRYTLQAFQQVVSIGKTTAKTLNQHGIANYIIASKPNETALAETCLDIINQRL